jgi:hypothetical protein
MNGLDPNIWGPHYWFFLHTISLNYPLRPNAIIKKKYYEFIQNFHMFIPVEKMSSNFSKLIKEYPVTPYLDSRDTFIRWVHFIHNKINNKLEKENVSLEKFYIDYYDKYKTIDIKIKDYFNIKGKILYLLVLIFLITSIFYLYNRY